MSVCHNTVQSTNNWFPNRMIRSKPFTLNVDNYRYPCANIPSGNDIFSSIACNRCKFGLETFVDEDLLYHQLKIARMEAVHIVSISR